MGTILNKKAFKELIEEDIVWLLDQPRTLERDHIYAILKVIPNMIYDPEFEVKQFLRTQRGKDETENNRDL